MNSGNRIERGVVAGSLIHFRIPSCIKMIERKKVLSAIENTQTAYFDFFWVMLLGMV
jgi:hypothetical protein